jgi:metal-sulfur cluster biosynthetic enzyme
MKQIQGSPAIRSAILEELSRVIDPETGADVVRMRLVEDMSVDDAGRVSYTFRPSSALCPIAVLLAAAIKNTVAKVPGVAGQTITVKGYAQAELLTELLNEEA